MTGKKRFIATFMVWIVAALPAFGQTAEDALKVVPEKAAGFAIINNLEAMSAKIEAVSKRLGMPLPFSPLEKLKSEIGIDNGLNTKGSLLVVMVLGKGEEVQPIPIFYVPVSDYQQFIKGLNAKTEGDVTTVQLHNGAKPMIVGKNGLFAVLTEPANGDILKEVLQPRAGANDALAPIRPYLAKNNVTGVLTPRGVKILTEKARAGLAQAKDNTPLPPEAKFVGDIFDGLDSFLKSVDSDVTYLVLGNHIDKAGNVEINKAALFLPGSSFAKAGAKASSLEGGPLPGLPNIPFLVALSGPMSNGGIVQELMEFSVKVMATMAKDVPAEKEKKLEEIGRKTLKNMRGISMVMGVGKDKQSLFNNANVIIKVNDAEAYLKNYEEYLQTFNDLMKGITLPEGLPKQSMKSMRTKVAGLPALQVTVDMGLDQQQNEMVRKMMEIYLGEGGKLVVTMVAADKNTVYMRYKPADSIKKMPTMKTGGLAQNKENVKTLQMLPEGSQWIALISPQGNVAFVNRVLETIMPQAAMKLPDFPKTPPIGFGLKMSATGVDLRLVIPAEVLESIGTYIQQLRKGPPGSQVSR